MTRKHLSRAFLLIARRTEYVRSRRNALKATFTFLTLTALSLVQVVSALAQTSEALKRLL